MSQPLAAQAGIRRLGMFGGAFDPPHNAHVALVRAAIAQLALDELRVFPTGQAWHKPTALSAPEHRLAMARLAFADIPAVAVDDREIRRSGPTYTVDTLRELRAQYPQAELYLVMGGDQAAALSRWREWREVVRLATLCVAGRPGSTDFATGPLADLRPPARFERIEFAPTTASATEIRRLAAESQGIAHLVPVGVARYIDQHHLYATT